jgi:phenylpyruvate tautomerase PptA (4-oxalocrotonate tautomerase family)
MPVVTIDIIKGAISKEGKLEMMRRVSEVVAEIESRPEPMENMLPFVYCIIRETEWGDFGQNGQPITPELLGAVKKGMVQITLKKP